ncbi:GGDEF domain-containing protein (plasmid) [Aliirhizobium terrae]|uniref:GGDEF domain-containing protein n=1 Tax=Terrirhizobium terrae TaxID=2926709 RepID=UPI002575FD9C|nr:GGDEF domain-containing protein [Rhizobium sp. CC-CFT758]WJH38823.1 GGDEF domain-containing protein [Rhizobium sp. CC-CFT758]
MAIDFTDEQTRIEQHRVDAETDPLTGLLNRRGLEARWSGSVSSGGAILAIDLDGFKAVNDRHGHDVGDQVLKIASQRLIASTRGHDIVSRVGGDEFLIIVSGDRKSAEAVAERIVRAFRSDISVGDIEAPVRASIGGALISASEPLAHTAARADQFLYEQKRAGKDGWKLEK